MSELHRRLEIFGSFEVGETLNITDLSRVPRHSWKSKAFRTWKGEDRSKMLKFIEDTLETAIRSLNSEPGIWDALRNLKRGLSNLKLTYCDDPEFQDRLDDCLIRVENSCTRFEQHLITRMEQIPIILESLTASDTLECLCLIRQTPIQSPFVTTPQTTQSPTGSITPCNREVTVDSTLTPPSTPIQSMSPNRLPLTFPIRIVNPLSFAVPTQFYAPQYRRYEKIEEVRNIPLNSRNITMSYLNLD